MRRPDLDRADRLRAQGIEPTLYDWAMTMGGQARTVAPSLPALTGVRFFAALAVLVSHFSERALIGVPEPVIDFLKTAPKDANPMDVMRTAVSMLGLYDPDDGREITPEINRKRATSITAKIGVIAATFIARGRANRCRRCVMT